MSEPAFDYRRLPVPERLKLVEDIWDSIAQEANADPNALPLTAPQEAELARRLEDADANPGDNVPWETIRDELFRRRG